MSKSLSFEIFPPRKDGDLNTILKTLDELKELRPNFISVTFGAGGSANSQNTLDIVNLVQNTYKTPSIVHLPCIHLNKEQVAEILKECKKLGLNKILALRGDIVEGKPISKDFKFASDLISFIKTQGDFEIYAAAYPEKHSEAKDFVEDIKHLKQKVEAGASTLLTQLFFDNEDFYKFKEKCDIAGINVPILAGIMPVSNKRQVLKITQMCGAKIPAKFAKILQKYENNDKAMLDAGLGFAIDQIIDLLTNDVAGIHLYTMNKPEIAKRIYTATHSLF